MRLIQVARSLLVAVSTPVLPILGRKGPMGVSTPDVSWSSASSSSSSQQFFRLVCFSNFSINGEALHLTGLCLIWLGVTIFSFSPSLSLFGNFQQFNVKVATIHHCIIQMEMDELLAKGVIEPSSSGDGFYCSMCVAPKHTGDL